MVVFLAVEATRCPAGHELSRSVAFLPHGLRECRFKPRPHGMTFHRQHCGLWIWEWSHGDGSRTVAAVSDAERRQIVARHLSPAEVPDLLCVPARTLDPLPRAGG